MKKTAACFAALLALTSLAGDKPAIDGAAPGLWTMDIEAAQRVAASKGLPLLVNFTGSDWCGWCQHMDKEVFSQDAWKAYAKENLMLVWIDFPNDKALVPQKYVARNKALAEQFGVEGYPSYIVLDSDGKKRLGQLGADQEINPARFIAQVKSVLKNRAGEADKLLQGLPKQVVQEYRELSKKLEDNRAELQALEASYKKRSSELSPLIETQEKRLAAILTEAALAKLPKDKSDAYTAKKTRRAKVTAELEAWIATNPDRNDDNTKKFKAWREELSTLETDMQALLDP